MGRDGFQFTFLDILMLGMFFQPACLSHAWSYCNGTFIYIRCFLFASFKKNLVRVFFFRVASEYSAQVEDLACDDKHIDKYRNVIYELLKF